MARLLILDDEQSYREYLQRYLVREGHEVRTAASGPEALSVAEGFEPDVLLADWMLKDDMHGLEVGMALRERIPNMRILLMTGFPSSEIREEAERAAVFAFIEKPFSLDEVAGAVAEAAES